MLQLGSRLSFFSVAPGDSGENDTTQAQPQTPPHTPQSFLQQVCVFLLKFSKRTNRTHTATLRSRKVAGLKGEQVFCNLRIPNQLQTARDDLNIILLTGQGVFCLDVKPWRGAVSAQGRSWHVQLQQDDQGLNNTCIEQVDDPLLAVTTKAANLCHHLKRSGVCVRQSLFLPRVVFLSPDCHLDPELRKRKELISHGQVDAFLASLRESYTGWLSDALTPSWLSGHLSYKQMEAVRGALARLGTWDLVRLRGGEQLRGDFQGCRYVALDRQETDTLEFSGANTLSPDSLWALLGHAPKGCAGMLGCWDAAKWYPDIKVA
ncbi:hypothetical protein NHX12_024635, partial [Muraenolepis orangiensis]